MKISKNSRLSCSNGLFIPTLITIVGCLILISLGTWQLYRLAWKESLIDTFLTKLHEPYINISRDNSYLSNLEEYKKVEVEGYLVPSKALKLMGRSYHGQSGYHYIVPLKIQKSTLIFIDMGWVPDKKNIVLNSDLKKINIRGFIRFKSEKNFMTPSNNILQKELYYLDPATLRNYEISCRSLPFYIVQSEPINQKIFSNSPPIIKKNPLNLRNLHLQYAITWYGLAFTLMIVYILYAWRLKFSR